MGLVFLNEDVFWAKKKEVNGKFLWMPLMQHLEDTGSVSVLLWEHWLSEGQKKFIKNSLSIKEENTAKKLVKFIGMVHDIGKATPVFQTMKGYLNSSELDILLLEKLERAGYKDITNLVLASPKSSRHEITGEYILSLYGVKNDIGSIIGGHHGKTVDNELDYKRQSSYEANLYQYEDKKSSIRDLWIKSQKHIFEYALKSCGFNSVESLPTIEQPAQILLLGLLVMADWITSNEEYFPLINIFEDYITNKDTRVRIGFGKWMKSDIWCPHRSENYIDLYKNRFGFEPRDVQGSLSKVISDLEKPGIIILEAPMGIGKTEASLIAAEQLAASTGRSGLFFGLPTQATSDGIFPRIISWLNSVSGDCDDKVQIRLAHGKACLNDIFNSIASGVGIDTDENNVVVNQWFSGRKTTSLDDFVVGTVDQFLLLSLKQKHLFLRHLGFSKKVVIIDEVHAYDAYMSQYLNQSVKWMGAYGVPVVLLSATLPSDKRSELVLSYLEGKYGKKPKEIRNEYREKLKTGAYPLITYTNGDNLCIEDKFKEIDNKYIKIDSFNEEDLITKLEDILEEGGVVGIIVNTVKRGQTFAKKLSEHFGYETVMLLHSAFIATERVKKEKSLLNMIGKGAIRPKKKIIIGTQVIEQSLDIDFDMLISDLAPVDLLIQRLGRLHRHTTSTQTVIRPKKHREPKLYILGTNSDYNFEEGARHVYGEYLLMRTQYFIEAKKHIAIPGDISRLVQDVYGDREIELSDELNSLYIKYKKDAEDKKEHKEKKAKTFRIDDPKNKKRENRRRKDVGLIGWFQNSNVDSNDSSDERACAQVRDSDETVEVVIVQKYEEGYSIYGENIDVSGLIDDSEIAKKLARNTIKLPRIYSANYMIDRTIDELEKYNNKYLNDWRRINWLKGSLGIILDENNEFKLCDKVFKYDDRYGVRMIDVERM